MLFPAVIFLPSQIQTFPFGEGGPLVVDEVVTSPDLALLGHPPQRGGFYTIIPKECVRLAFCEPVNLTTPLSFAGRCGHRPLQGKGQQFFIRF